ARFRRVVHGRLGAVHVQFVVVDHAADEQCAHGMLLSGWIPVVWTACRSGCSGRVKAAPSPAPEAIAPGGLESGTPSRVPNHVRSRPRCPDAAVRPGTPGLAVLRRAVPARPRGRGPARACAARGPGLRTVVPAGPRRAGAGGLPGARAGRGRLRNGPGAAATPARRGAGP